MLNCQFWPSIRLLWWTLVSLLLPLPLLPGTFFLPRDYFLSWSSLLWTEHQHCLWGQTVAVRILEQFLVLGLHRHWFWMDQQHSYAWNFAKIFKYFKHINDKKDHLRWRTLGILLFIRIFVRILCIRVFVGFLLIRILVRGLFVRIMVWYLSVRVFVELLRVSILISLMYIRYWWRCVMKIWASIMEIRVRNAIIRTVTSVVWDNNMNVFIFMDVTHVFT